jgi:hypothetical protein
MPTLSRYCAALSLLLLSACAFDVISPDDPLAFIPDRSSEIAVGRMDRAAARQVLGEPRLASRYWRFDLFRADTEQANVVVAVTPWPIPFARIKDQLQRYTLVAYDADDRVVAVTSGVFRRPAEWRNVSPIQSDFPALHLRADDLMFFVDPEGARRENLLVAPASRDRFLQRARAGTGCTAVLGCGERGCADQLTVDQGDTRRLPVRLAHVYWLKQANRAAWLRDVAPQAGEKATPWLETLVAIRLPAGEHRLEFSVRHLDGRHAIQFACRPGEVAYLTIDALDNGRFMNRALVDWRVERADTLPPRYTRRPLVILDDGAWQIETEPVD